MREIPRLDTERELIRQAADGDARAIRTLYDRYAPRVYAIVRRIAADDDLAQDYAQEAWIRAIRALPTFRGDARFSTWLYRIATNLALNELRRPRRRAVHTRLEEPGGPALAGEAPAAEDLLDARRLSARVDLELARLPERQRAALCLTAVEGLSYAEVAAALEISESAVKALVHRARTALAERIGDGE